MTKQTTVGRWFVVIAIVASVGVYTLTTREISKNSKLGELPAKEFDIPAQEIKTKSQFNFNALPAPRAFKDISFLDGQGQTVYLSKFKGKMVLLNIWATWCTPCREEMPTLDRLQAKLGSEDFQVIALSIDSEGPSAVREFYSELELNSLSIYVDPSMEVTNALSVIGIPATLLLNRNGMEIGRVFGPAEWDSEDVINAIKKYLPPT